MAKHLTFFGHYDDDGNPHFPKEMRSMIAEQFRGKRVTFTVMEDRSQRSPAQSRYFEGCVMPLVMEALQELGWEEANPRNKFDRDRVKRMLLRECWTNDVIELENPETGEFIVLEPSSTDLDTKEWEQWMEEIRRWAINNLKLYIPEPNEQIKLGY